MERQRRDSLDREPDLIEDPEKMQDGAEDAGEPRQPVTEERQHTPDDGSVPVAPEADIMEEARDGFMDRYPPRGQTS